VTVKVAVVAPAETVTLAGTVAFGLLDERLMTEPPAGAAVKRVTVPVADAPPTTDVGDTETLESPGGFIDRVAVWVLPLNVAEIVDVVLAVTDFVVTGNVAEEYPAATVTDAGTPPTPVAERATTDPPVGAAVVRVTVPVEEAPPITEIGDKVTLATPGAVIVSVAVLEAPLKVAVIVDVVDVDTELVATLNVAEAAPAPMVTDAGTVAPLVAESATTTPPEGAAEPSVTVPVEGLPPTTETGESVTPESVGAALTVRGAVTVK